jgi:hypothetical protein
MKTKIRGEIWNIVANKGRFFFCEGLTGIVKGQYFYFDSYLDNVEFLPSDYEVEPQEIIEVPETTLPLISKLTLGRFYDCLGKYS